MFCTDHVSINDNQIFILLNAAELANLVLRVKSCFSVLLLNRSILFIYYSSLIM